MNGVPGLSDSRNGSIRSVAAKAYDTWLIRPTHVGDVTGCREVADCIEVFLAWPDAVVGDLESRKLDCVGSEHEFLRVEGDAVPSTEVEPVDSLIKASVEVVSP